MPRESAREFVKRRTLDAVRPAAERGHAPHGRRLRRPLFRSTFGRQVWKPAVTRAGLQGFTFHGLRHSFVAILVAAGCNVRKVSEWAGHNSVAFTLTRYGGLFEDGSDEAVNRLDALLADRPDRTNVRDLRRS